MCVLFQFFDPVHHYFTFPDYQLVPTLEEFSLLLRVPVLDQIPFTGLDGIPKPEVITEGLHLKRADIIANWETRSGVKGFLAKFLLEKAHSFWDDMDFQVLYPKICPPIFPKTFQEKFTSPTRRVIFRCSFTKISLITYSQIQVWLKSQLFKEGIRMCEFSRRNMVKKCAESAVFTR